ncbi:MAG: NUDIX hydrolase [Candidatus Helarchaeales archaeon]
MRYLKETSRKYPTRPLFGVGVIIVKDERVLMIKRASEPNKGFWSIPGGMVEYGETCEEAAVRECFEEVNLKILPEDLKFVDIVNKIVRDDEGRIKYHVVIGDYITHEFQGEPRAKDDALNATWVKFSDIPKLKMTSSLKLLFQKVNIGNWEGIITEEMLTDYS